MSSTVRIFRGDTRISTGVLCRNNTLMQVFPSSRKKYSSLGAWFDAHCKPSATESWSIKIDKATPKPLPPPLTPLQRTIAIYCQNNWISNTLSPTGLIRKSTTELYVLDQGTIKSVFCNKEKGIVYIGEPYRKITELEGSLRSAVFFRKQGRNLLERIQLTYYD